MNDTPTLVLAVMLDKSIGLFGKSLGSDVGAPSNVTENAEERTIRIIEIN